MKERPILFSAPMVRAILEGRKTQTRRLVKRELKHPGWTDYHLFGPSNNNPDATYKIIECGPDYPDDSDDQVKCPYADRPGDRLWVRETWQHSNFPFGPYDQDANVFYRADYFNDPHGPDGEKSPEGKYRHWNPSIHMPRSASRINLQITGVRVERLQDISYEDAVAEGMYDPTTAAPFPHQSGETVAQYARRTGFPQRSYRTLWEELNGSGSWDVNPWVWVIEFQPIEVKQ